MTTARSDLGQLAIVTGATGGQGAAVARALASHGYALGLVDLHRERLSALAEEIRGLGGRSLWAVCDIADRSAVRATFANFESELGPLRILAATAAILRGSMLLDLEDETFDATMRVNVRGAYVTNTEAAQLMISAAQGGRIINWSSVSSRRSSLSHATYAASKCALESLSKSLALALAKYRITVNVVLPGSIRTPMLGYVEGSEYEAFARRVPLQRWGEPEDVVAAVLYLASDEAGWVTGTELVVDGGLLVTSAPPDEEADRARLERERAYLASNQPRVPRH